MATIPNGILGGIRGRIGIVSGYNRYGVDVIRIAKNGGTVKPTAKRLVQRSKITVYNVFAKAFAGTGFFTFKKNDKAILVAYFPSTNEVVYSFDAGTRESGNAVLETVN